ncbi:MAG: putative Zn finger-like uncharacterized protein [Candidatus Midichloriaceae bacterium]|jgi:predicted Zn finger-like uncharacterized protein
MIIICKNCDTKFLVNNEDISENARMVNCSVCEYEWLYIPDKSSKDSENIFIKENQKKIIFDQDLDIEKPANITSPNNTSGIIFINIMVNFFLVIVVISSFFYFEKDFLVQQHELLENFYSHFGYYNVEKLEIKISDPVKKLWQDKDDGMYYYEIPIKIINKEALAKYVPIINIKVYNKKKLKLFDLQGNIRKSIPVNDELNIIMKTNPTNEEIGSITALIGNANDMDSDNIIKSQLLYD